MDSFSLALENTEKCFKFMLKYNNNKYIYNYIYNNNVKRTDTIKNNGFSKLVITNTTSHLLKSRIFTLLLILAFGMILHTLNTFIDII